MHPLLARQLRRLGIVPDAGPPLSGPWTDLLARVNRAYEEHDQERYLLERSQELASQEMSALYATVQADRDLLDNRVQERTDALRLSEARLSSLLSLSADWIWEQDEELRFSFFSDGIETATGMKAGRLSKGLPPTFSGQFADEDQYWNQSASARPVAPAHSVTHGRRERRMPMASSRPCTG